MKRKLFVLALALICLLAFTGCCFHSEWYAANCTTPKTCVKCGEIEGEALGHSWVDATCTDPKTCSACHLTEGEALGHIWVEATTEAPKTCTTCAATEGERIVTDPRFTTASTAELQGLWSSVITLNGAALGFDPFYTFGNSYLCDVELLYTMELYQDGTMYVNAIVLNEEEFLNGATEYYTNYMYSELAQLGYDKETGNAAYQEVAGKTVEEEAREAAEAVDLSTLAFMQEGVYYVEAGSIHMDYDWNDEMDSSPFTLEGDELTMADPLGNVKEITFTRVTE